MSHEVDSFDSPYGDGSRTFRCGLLGPVHVLKDQKSPLVFEVEGFNGGAYTLEQIEEAIAVMQAAMWYAKGQYSESFLKEE